MLFDLKGRRRRLIQVVYLFLALLMGGGLVFFGIGGSVSGGLFDAFSSNGSQSGSNQSEQRLEEAQTALAQDPEDETALVQKIRASYQLAQESVNAETGQPTDTSRGHLEAADEGWRAYLELNPDAPDPEKPLDAAAKRPDGSLASLMLRVYDENGLGEPGKAAQAAALVAQAQPSSNAYLLLIRYASIAGDERTADLAARKAVELADKSSRDAIQKQAEQIKQAGLEQAKARENQATDGGAAGPTGGSGDSPASSGRSGGGSSGKP